VIEAVATESIDGRLQDGAALRPGSVLPLSVRSHLA
jgi:hypothetical protein